MGKRTIVVIFGVIPATLLLPGILMLFYFFFSKPMFSISMDLLKFFVLPLGGILGIFGLWIFAIKKNTSKLLITFLMLSGMSSAIVTFLTTGQSAGSPVNIYWYLLTVYFYISPVVVGLFIVRHLWVKNA